MRSSPLIICWLAFGGSLHSQELKPTDREAILGKLAEIENNVDSLIDSRYRLAINAYRQGMGSEEKAINLYLDCYEKVEFTDEHKKAQEFREWKRKDEEKLSNLYFRRALRHQLQWLSISLEAASPKVERSSIIPRALEIVNSIVEDADKINGQQEILNRNAMNSVFAKAYGIDSVKLEDWPTSPIKLDDVYEMLVFPSYRKPGRTADLRSAWLKYIQQEIHLQEVWSKKPPEPKDKDGKNNEKKDSEKIIGMADEMRTPEFDKFMNVEVPKLVWQMEVDLFKNGDQSQGAVRMLTHIEKYSKHPNCRDWVKELRSLISPTEEVITGPANGLTPTPPAKQ